MNFLFDENLSPRLLEHFPHAVHIYGAMTAGTSDREILNFATDNDLVVVTGDTDFGALLAASGVSKPSVILIRALLHLPAQQQARIILANLDQLQEIVQRGAVVVISENDIRVRPLPIT